jgi:hypothetical protein
MSSLYSPRNFSKPPHLYSSCLEVFELLHAGGHTDKELCVCVLHTYIYYIHTDRSKAMSAFWQIDVAKTPTICVVYAVCFAYLVYQFI